MADDLATISDATPKAEAKPKVSPKDKGSGPAPKSKGESGEGETKTKAPPKSQSHPRKTVTHAYHRAINKKPVSVAEADRMILLCIGGSLGVVAIAHFAGDKKLEAPGSVFRAVGGSIVAGVGLMILAEFQSDLAKMFGILFFVSTILGHSEGMVKGLNAITSPNVPGGNLPPAIEGKLPPKPNFDGTQPAPKDVQPIAPGLGTIPARFKTA